jgi:hypothetical protein
MAEGDRPGAEWNGRRPDCSPRETSFISSVSIFQAAMQD